MSDYPRKIRLVVSLTTGEEVQSKAITISDEKSEENWSKLLRSPKQLEYLAVPQDNAFGEEDSIYFNPTYITHIRVINVVEE